MGLLSTLSDAASSRVDTEDAKDAVIGAADPSGVYRAGSEIGWESARNVGEGVLGGSGGTTTDTGGSNSGGTTTDMVEDHVGDDDDSYYGQDTLQERDNPDTDVDRSGGSDFGGEDSWMDWQKDEDGAGARYDRDTHWTVDAALNFDTDTVQNLTREEVPFSEEDEELFSQKYQGIEFDDPSIFSGSVVSDNDPGDEDGRDIEEGGQDEHNIGGHGPAGHGGMNYGGDEVTGGGRGGGQWHGGGGGGSSTRRPSGGDSGGIPLGVIVAVVAALGGGAYWYFY